MLNGIGLAKKKKNLLNKKLSEEFWSQPWQWPHERKEYVFLAQAAYQVSGRDNWLAEAQTHLYACPFKKADGCSL